MRPNLFADLRSLALLAGGRWGIVYRDLMTSEGVSLGEDEVFIKGPAGAYVLVCLSDQGENNTVATQAIAQMSRAVWKAFGAEKAG